MRHRSNFLAVFSRTPRKAAAARDSGRLVLYRPRLETFEDRIVPSILTVVNNLDSGPGSLRDTLATASSNDTIMFDPSLNGQTIALTSGELAITQNVDIEGPGANLLTISGHDASRVFDITSASVIIAGLTITHGSVADAQSGGGISNGGTLTLNNAILNGNSVGGVYGYGGRHLQHRHANRQRLHAQRQLRRLVWRRGGERGRHLQHRNCYGHRLPLDRQLRRLGRWRP